VEIAGKKFGLTFMRDITSERRTLEQLRYAEARFKTIFDSSLIGISITSIPQGEYIDCNQAFLDIIGCSREEVIGKTSTEVGTIGAANVAAEMEAMLLESGTLKDQTAEITVGGKRVVLFYSAVVANINGRGCAIWFVRDFTEQAAIMEQLRQSEAKFKQIFQGGTDAIAINDRDFKYVDVNDAFITLTGYTREELIGKTPQEVGIIDRDPQVWAANAKFLCAAASSATATRTSTAKAARL
jgi:PAS domain S-box-containing protein